MPLPGTPALGFPDEQIEIVKVRLGSSPARRPRTAVRDAVVNLGRTLEPVAIGPGLGDYEERVLEVARHALQLAAEFGWDGDLALVREVADETGPALSDDDRHRLAAQMMGGLARLCELAGLEVGPVSLARGQEEFVTLAGIAIAASTAR